jgi:hypothetical protein
LRERGSALLETLVIGSLALLFIGLALVAVGRIAAAGGRAEEAAHTAAVIAADRGEAGVADQVAGAIVPGADVTVTDDGHSVTVEVIIEVSLVGPASGPVTVPVRGVATVPRSPYRSGS